jgi:hypothetical protein
LQTEPEYGYEDMAKKVARVTPLTKYNRKQSVFASSMGAGRGTETIVNVLCGDLSLFARIGKAGERLSYPRGAQPEEEDEDSEPR